MFVINGVVVSNEEVKEFWDDPTRGK